MTHGLRSIAFVAELIHPPVKHEPRGLQKLHGELFGSAHCSYRDFRMVPGGAQFSNAAGGMPGAPVSAAAVLADRIQIREEQTGTSKDEFEARLRALATSALSNLPVQTFMVQQFAVRSVLNPHASGDALGFMLQTVFGFDESLLAAFPTPPSLSGLRFAFPPRPQDQAVFNVRIESFAQDNRSLFVENVGTYAQPVAANQIDELSLRFDSTYAFLQEHVVDFVAQFDASEEED